MQPAGPVVALHEADSNAAPTVAQSDDEGAASEAPKSGCDTSECGSAEEGAGGAAAAELRVALRGLGGRGGGLRSCEAAELERLSRGEASRDVRAGARVDVGMQDVDVEGAGGDVARKQAAFRCEMLMTKERPDPESDAVWRCLSCEDEDDFVALTERRCSFFGDGGALLWEAGDHVLLWDAEEVDLPFGGGAERFQRFAIVLLSLIHI